MSEPNTEREFAEVLQAILEDVDSDEFGHNAPGMPTVRTYEEVGMLTHNEGLVVRFDGGAEFRITIHQAAEARVMTDGIESCPVGDSERIEGQS